MMLIDLVQKGLTRMKIKQQVITVMIRMIKESLVTLIIRWLYHRN